MNPISKKLDISTFGLTKRGDRWRLTSCAGRSVATVCSSRPRVPSLQEASSVGFRELVNTGSLPARMSKHIAMVTVQAPDPGGRGRTRTWKSLFPAGSPKLEIPGPNFESSSDLALARIFKVGRARESGREGLGAPRSPRFPTGRGRGPPTGAGCGRGGVPVPGKSGTVTGDSERPRFRAT
jgi:hypothetical protein